ncbi:uncharacterized protein LOC130414680 isoform X3 [Triplophysa dalaica]|uniref:uncharacterized protein LOC130414680 isoform X3 n=1 Tax=Triplophysa dalaica TaxID=1582913 RepID=UPI0024E02A7A|nr:uncharacterized protein LOC130414680 isoform X3 [Triplophysa dalaica]
MAAIARPARIRTGDRGCPYWDISPEQLEYLLEFNFTVKQIAQMFCVSYRTIRRRMSEYGLSVKMYYSDITDEDLRQLVCHFIRECPDSGIKRVSGYLNSVGLRVQRSRVMETLRTVDPVGTICRGLGINIIQRRVYSVPAPMALWHIDGNHKLIRSLGYLKEFVAIRVERMLRWHALCLSIQIEEQEVLLPDAAYTINELKDFGEMFESTCISSSSSKHGIGMRFPQSMGGHHSSFGLKDSYRTWIKFVTHFLSRHIWRSTALTGRDQHQWTVMTLLKFPHHLKICTVLFFSFFKKELIHLALALALELTFY